MSLPKEMWYVRAGSDGKSRMYEKKGGKYTSLQAALDHIAQLRRRGYDPKLFKSELTWTEVVLDEDPRV